MASTFWNTLFSTSHINVPDPDIEQHAGNQDKDISSSPPHPSLSDPLFIPSSGATLHLWGAKLSLQATILQQTQAVHQQLLETIQTQVEKLSQAVESQAEILSAAKVEIEAASVALKEAESRKKKNKKQRKEKDFKNGEGKSNDKKAQLSFHEAQVERLDEDAEDEDDDELNPVITMKLSTIQQQLAILSSALAEEHTRNKRKDEETAKQRAQELARLEEKLVEVARNLHTKEAMMCFRCKSNIPEENLKGTSPAKESRQSVRMEDALRGNDISPRRIQSDTGTITAAENDKPVTEPEVKKTKSAKRTLLDGSQDNWEELNQPDVMKSTLWQAPPTPTEKSRPRKRRLLQSQYDDDI